MTNNNSSNNNDDNQLNARYSFLNTLPSSVGDKTGKWILDLKQDAVDTSENLKFNQPEAQNSISQNASPRFSHLELINNFYNTLTKFAFEFSKGVASSDLKINCEPLNSFKIPPNPYVDPKINYGMQGHFYTKQWAMVLRADPDNLKVYVILTQYLIRLSSAGGGIQPYMQFDFDNNSKKWLIDGEEIKLDLLNTLAKKLFTYFVNVLQGSSNGSERFYLKPPEQKVKPNSPFIDNGPAFLTSKDNSSVLTSNMPGNHQAQNNNSQSNQSLSNQNNINLSGFNQSSPSVQSMQSSDITGSIDSRLQDHTSKVVSIIDNINKEYDFLINSLTQLSAQAMTHNDTASALKILKCINVINAQKSGINNFLIEWNNSISS